MAKKRKKTSKAKSKTSAGGEPGRLRRWWNGLDAERRRAVRRHVAWTVLALALLAGGAFGLKVLEAQVLTRVRARPPVAARVELVDAPAWMPAALRRHLREQLAPARGAFFDADLSRRLYDRAAGLPWFRGVRHVEKELTDDPDLGRIRLWAAYRRPYALVRHGTTSQYVDREGVVLPDAYVPRWQAAGEAPATFLRRAAAPAGTRLRPIHYILIDGVVAEPPPEPGQRWGGADLQAGLRLVEWIREAPYWRQVTVVDVRNHDHRQDRRLGGPLRPELVLKAYDDSNRAGGFTTIVFGSFPRPGGDYVVAPARKRAYLDAFVRRHGRLAGAADTIYLVYDQLRTGPMQ